MRCRHGTKCRSDVVGPLDLRPAFMVRCVTRFVITAALCTVSYVACTVVVQQYLRLLCRTRASTVPRTSLVGQPVLCILIKLVSWRGRAMTGMCSAGVFRRSVGRIRFGEGKMEGTWGLRASDRAEDMTTPSA